MGQTHSSTEVDYGRPRPLLAFVLFLVVLGIAAASILGMVALWPDSDKVPRGQNPYAAEGVSSE